MSTKAIATSTLWQIGSQVTMAVLSMVTVKLVAIGLTKELAGNYNSAYGYLQIFGILADFGLYAVAVREISRAKDRGHVTGVFLLLRAGILLISLLFGLAVAWSVPAWRGTPLPLGITIASLVPLFTLLAGMFRATFQVEYRMHYVFIAEVLQRVISASLIAFLVLTKMYGPYDLHGYHMMLFAGGLGAFLLFLLSGVFAKRFVEIKIEWDYPQMKKFFLSAAPYGVAFLCIALYRQMDTTLIALLRPDFELQNAYYGFVLRMMEMAFLIPTFLLNSVLPVLNERDEKGEDTSSLLKTTFMTLLIIGMSGALFAFFWARPVVSLMTTQQYLSTALRPGSDSALQILSGSIFLNTIVLYSFYTLLTKHAWKPLVKTLLIGAVFSILFNIWIIPQFGFRGVAVTSVCTHLLLAALLLPQSLRAFHVPIPLRMWLRFITFTIAIGLILFVTKPLLANALYTLLGLGIVGLIVMGLAWTFVLKPLTTK